MSLPTFNEILARLATTHVRLQHDNRQVELDRARATARALRLLEAFDIAWRYEHERIKALPFQPASPSEVLLLVRRAVQGEAV